MAITRVSSSLAALAEATDDELIEHCRRVAEIVPLVGFYLQPSVGGRPLWYGFWRRFVEIPQVVAIKIAPFNRYQTLDVVRALADSQRDDIALYTGNDDSIVADLVTPYRFARKTAVTELRIVGGCWVIGPCGHKVRSGCWRTAIRPWKRGRYRCRCCEPPLRSPTRMQPSSTPPMDSRGASPASTTCFAGRGCSRAPDVSIHKRGSAQVRRRISTACAKRIRHLKDDDFVAAHLDEWLRG